MINGANDDSFIKLQVPFQTSYIIFIFLFFSGFFQTVNDHQLNILLWGFVDKTFFCGLLYCGACLSYGLTNLEQRKLSQ